MLLHYKKRLWCLVHPLSFSITNRTVTEISPKLPFIYSVKILCRFWVILRSLYSLYFTECTLKRKRSKDVAKRVCLSEYIRKPIS